MGRGKKLPSIVAAGLSNFHFAAICVSRLRLAARCRIVRAVREGMLAKPVSVDDFEGVLVRSEASAANVEFAAQDPTLRAHHESRFCRVDSETPHHPSRVN